MVSGVAGTGILLPKTMRHFADMHGYDMGELDLPDHRHLSPHQCVTFSEPGVLYPFLPKCDLLIAGPA